jgi:hypothetical protein
MASFQSFVAAFWGSSGAPEKVFTKALTGCIPSGIDTDGSEGTDHLKRLLAVVAAVQSTLLPRLANVGCTVELNGVTIPMEMLCAAPVHLVSGQHIAGFDAVVDLEEKPVKEQKLTLQGCLGKILPPALLAVLKAQSWVLEQDLMKDRAKACTEHCMLRCVAFAGSVMEACTTLAAKVMSELSASLASEAMGNTLALIQPDFPKGVQKKMLAALDNNEVAELHGAMKHAMDMGIIIDATIADARALLVRFPGLASFAEPVSVHLQKLVEATAAQQNDELMTQAGLALGNLTACQAAFRSLEPGESRKALCSKVLKGLAKRRWHAMATPVETYVSSLTSSGQ